MYSRKEECHGMANLKKQVRRILSSKLAYGESKHLGKRDGSAAGKIYSKGSFDCYLKIGNLYSSYIASVDPECRSISEALKKGHARGYIEYLIQTGKSPYTIINSRAALAKIHGIDGTQIHNDIPKRCVKDIKNSRRPIQRDLRARERYPDLYAAAESSGLRAYKELGHLRPEDIHLNDGKVEVFVRSGKNGMSRTVTCLPGYEELWTKLKENGTPHKPVFPYIPHASLHQCRARFATTLYLQNARPTDELHGEKIRVYDSRTGRWHVYPAIYRTKDGRTYDRAALIICSRELGHGVTRSSMVCNHYIRL